MLRTLCDSNVIMCVFVARRRSEPMRVTAPDWMPPWRVGPRRVPTSLTLCCIARVLWRRGFGEVITSYRET